MNKFWRWSKDEVSQGAADELILEGVIASESWWGDEVTPAAFREELKNHAGDLTVRINSPGGDVYAGLSIYNALVEHEGKVTIKVDGIAASIASVVAMAGDSIVMNPGAMMMVHKPWTVAMGNADDMKETAAYLEKVGSSIVPIYTERTGQTEEKINELLDAETYMTAQEAVDLGFADEAIKPKSNLSEAVNAALSYMKPVKAAVTQPAMSLHTKLEAEHAEKVKEETNVSTDTTETTESEDAVETAPADEAAAEVEEKEVVEDMTTQTTEVTEPVVEAKETKSVETKQETNMSKQDEAAVEGVVKAEAPKQAVVVNEGAKLKAYLKSNEAMEAFAKVLESHPGQMGGDSSAQVRNSWKEHLETKMGVTNPEIFLPTPLVTAIQNAFEDGGEIWNRVAKVGADVWNAAWDTEDDVNSNDGRGRGYNRADAEDKAEQVLTFDDRILRPQFVYKYITLNKEDIKEQRSTGALVTYVLSELPQRIVREVERAIVLGDGRASDDDYKIKEGNPRGFFPILADAAASNFFADEVTLVGTESQAEAVAMARDLIKTPGEVVLIAKKGYATAARFEKDVDGRLLFPLGSRAEDVLGVSTIIEPDWFTDTNSPNYDAVVVVLSGYKVVGDTTIEGFQNFILKTNKQEYLQEIWAGGGLSTKKAAIAIPATAS